MPRKQQKPITVADLKDQTGEHHPRPILYCNTRGEESSANKVDYFYLHPNHTFTHCGRPMRLVVKQTVYVTVKP